jgi:hypothetical protein
VSVLLVPYLNLENMKAGTDRNACPTKWRAIIVRRDIRDVLKMYGLQTTRKLGKVNAGTQVK